MTFELPIARHMISKQVHDAIQTRKQSRMWVVDKLGDGKTRVKGYYNLGMEREVKGNEKKTSVGRRKKIRDNIQQKQGNKRSKLNV